MTVDTEGSTPEEKLIVPTPRIDSAESLLVLPLRKVRVGTRWNNCSAELTFDRSSWSPETTEIATGTSCKFCARFCAVTMMSVLANGASASAAASCAAAGAAGRGHARD